MTLVFTDYFLDFFAKAPASSINANTESVARFAPI